MMRHPRRAVITGAGSGIGHALAKGLAQDGATCFLCDIDARGLARAELPAVDGAVHHRHVLDVADRSGQIAAAALCVARFGVPDLVVLNAGITTTGARIEDIDPAHWRRIFSVNVDGVLYGLQAWIPHLLDAARPARILVIGSVLSHFGVPRAADYVATKHAVLALAEVAAMELRDTPVRVLLACPGLVDTSLAAGRRGGALDDRPRGLPAPEAAARILEAVAQDDFLIFTHPEYAPALGARHRATQHGLLRITDAPSEENAAFLSGAVLSLYGTR